MKEDLQCISVLKTSIPWRIFISVPSRYFSTCITTSQYKISGTDQYRGKENNNMKPNRNVLPTTNNLNPHLNILPKRHSNLLRHRRQRLPTLKA